MQVTSHLPKFPGDTETDFRRWLFRIATNAVNSHLRQTRRRQELWDAAASRRQWKHGDLNHSSATEYDLLDWPTVYQALLELEERDQTIIMMRFFSDCDFEEIGFVVNVTPGAARTALSRALARLRERFSTASETWPALGQTERGN